MKMVPCSMTKRVPLSFAFSSPWFHPYSALAEVLAVQVQSQKLPFLLFLPQDLSVLAMPRLTVDKLRMESQRQDVVWAWHHDDTTVERMKLVTYGGSFSKAIISSSSLSRRLCGAASSFSSDCCPSLSESDSEE